MNCHRYLPVFETAGKDDGSAPIDIHQDDIFSMLCKNSIFRNIVDTGQWNDLWTPRNVFVCSDPLVTYHGFFADIYTGKRGELIKVFKNHEYGKELKRRSSMFMRMLGGYQHFPSFISENDDSITMPWCGPRTSHISGNDRDIIIGVLKLYGITHRDIRPDNLLFNGKNTVLIDFAFAIRPGELSQTSHDLGKPYKCPHGFNDDYSIRKVQQELLCR